jgi:hypothetical protein
VPGVALRRSPGRPGELAHEGSTAMDSRPSLTVEQILAWADAHHRRTGRWPGSHSGPVEEAPEETWRAISQALRNGFRGLPGGSSLVQLLAQKRDRSHSGRPHLKEEQILAWADGHFRRTGRWPNAASGAVLDAPGENWRAINTALRAGNRGLPGASSLSRLLRLHGRRHSRPA